MGSIDIATLVKSLLSWQSWLIFVVVALGGGLGGYAHKLSAPPEDKTALIRYLVVGVVASLAVLFVFTPEDPVKLIALSLAAGYGGKSVLDALEAKVKAALAEAAASRAKEDGLRATAIGRQLADYVEKLSGITVAAKKEHAQAVPSEDELKRLTIQLEVLEKSFQK